jgi:hypothetical protein
MSITDTPLRLRCAICSKVGRLPREGYGPPVIFSQPLVYGAGSGHSRTLGVCEDCIAAAVYRAISGGPQ